MRFGELICLGIALACETVDYRPSWITQTHNLRAFVYGFSRSIIDGLPQHLHIIVGTDKYNLRVSARHQQTKEWQRRTGGIIIALLDKMSHNMALEMVDIYQRYIQST